MAGVNYVCICSKLSKVGERHHVACVRHNDSKCNACKGTGVLDCRVIDGTEGNVTCGFCGRAPDSGPIHDDFDTKRSNQIKEGK